MINFKHSKHHVISGTLVLDVEEGRSSPMECREARKTVGGFEAKVRNVAWGIRFKHFRWRAQVEPELCNLCRGFERRECDSIGPQLSGEAIAFPPTYWASQAMYIPLRTCAGPVQQPRLGQIHLEIQADPDPRSTPAITVAAMRVNAAFDFDLGIS